MSHLFHVWKALFYRAFHYFLYRPDWVDRGLTKNIVVRRQRAFNPVLPVFRILWEDFVSKGKKRINDKLKERIL